jgi:hypothetical protein
MERVGEWYAAGVIAAVSGISYKFRQMKERPVAAV